MTDKKHIIIERPRQAEKLPVWFAVLDVDAYWCDWKLIRCGVLNEDGTPAHYGEGCWPSEECTDIEKAEPTLSGHIKWDGCMEFSAGDGASNVHVCDGPQSALEIFLAWNWLLTEAHEAMEEAGAKDSVNLMWEPLEIEETPPLPPIAEGRPN